MRAFCRPLWRENPVGRKKIQASGLIFMSFYGFFRSVRRFSIDSAASKG